MTALSWRAAVLALAVTGCASAATIPAPAPATAPGLVSPVSSPASPMSALARIADEGRITQSVTLQPGQCHARDDGRLPDPACTPGAVDPAVTPATIAQTICVHGWTATVRPPASETTPLKYDTAYPAYSLPPGTVSELDHLVPLELGGANDVLNLWPEAGSVPNAKDRVESVLREAVCAGRVTLAAAQDAIAADWETAEATLGLTP